MSSVMLEKMRAKLARLESEFSELFENAPWAGHGGTPYIMDNSKGRVMKNAADKHKEKMSAKNQAIIEQKEKIERMENKICLRSAPTKKSEKRIKKTPISPALLCFCETGELKQWAKNPDIFFSAKLKRVAFTTMGCGGVGILRKYWPSPEELPEARDLLKRLQSHQQTYAP